MKHPAAAVLLIALALLTATNLPAALQHPNNERGFQAETGSQVGKIDHVNLFNYAGKGGRASKRDTALSTGQTFTQRWTWRQPERPVGAYLKEKSMLHIARDMRIGVSVATASRSLTETSEWCVSTARTRSRRSST